MPTRICGTVTAGVPFPISLGFTHQEPRGDKRENLMVMPAAPVANVVMRQARLVLAAFDRFPNAMGRQCHAGELLRRRLARSVREVVVVLGRAFVVRRANDERLIVLHDALADLGLDAARRDLYFQGTLVPVTDIGSESSIPKALARRYVASENRTLLVRWL